MLRSRAAAAIAAAALAVTGAAYASPAAPAAAVTVVASDASSIPADVRRFRAGVVAELRSNMARYGDRLTAAERRRVNELIGDVDRDLRALQRATAKSARLARDPGQHRAADRAATTAAREYDAGYAKAMRSLAEFQPILQPRLSLFEALRAKSALDAHMAAYEELGRRIHAAAD